MRILSSARFRPQPWMRFSSAVLLVLLTGNLFWHGAQPYAVGLIPSPWDKLAHALLFGALAVLAWVAYSAQGLKAAAAALTTAFGLGALDEIRQFWLPGRQLDLVDIAADLVGATVFIVIAASAARLRRVHDADRRG